jgi:malate synthase
LNLTCGTLHCNYTHYPRVAMPSLAQSAPPSSSGIDLTDPFLEQSAEILTAEALDFVAGLARAFRRRIDTLLTAREQHRAEWANGQILGFREDTVEVREQEWHVGPIPHDLTRRIVEITGPVDRKMVINALNSGADAFMADFEDATAPTWRNMIEGQINLRDAVRGTIAFTDPASGKVYLLGETVATLMVRPRGLHLPEAHVTVDGRPIAGALFDAGLYLFHNAHHLIERGSGPYFYLPKLECAEEAALWNDFFVAAQARLGIPRGTIKATVLIETLPAAFQMDEILFALREHAAGLNCGRWDYIFSFIKTRRNDPTAVLPDRSQVNMTQPCMRAYTQLAIRTCHRRAAFAMGGMAAQIPVKQDSAANDAAFERVRADKLREVTDGHDGTWVAHPALVAVAREAFQAHMTGDNQLHRMRDDVQVTAADLLSTPSGTCTEEGLRLNIRVGIQYIEAWLRGQGAVPLYYLMEDAATAEISRTQVWQWIRHSVTLTNGKIVTRALVESLIQEELLRITAEIGEARMHSGKFDVASALFIRLASSETLEEFLTLAAYPLLDDLTPRVVVATHEPHSGHSS